MPTVEYTKKRSIASGSVGQSAQLEFGVQDSERFDKPASAELMTMGKAVASVLKHIMQGWKVTTIPVVHSESEIEKWREFLHSCAAREPFLYDPEGTIANPGSNIVTVTLVPSTWTFSRKGLGTDLMTISMEFEETAP